MHWIDKSLVGFHSRRSSLRLSLIAAIWTIAALFSFRVVQAAYEVPNAAYNPPTHYYDTAAGTGFTLRTNLHNIISTGFVGRSYGASRYNMATVDSNGAAKVSIDQDPNNPNNIILIYNRASIPGTWDAGVTWNREHQWPKKWLGVTSEQVSNSYVGPASDSFELRPSNPSVNSSRNDDGYGLYPYSGSYGANSGYWYPGTPDTGEVARVMFYMATRYFNPSNPLRGTDIQNLQLVNGAPSVFNMGDLNSFLHWNYEYGVDNFERHRNQYIYGSAGDLTNHALNPTYYQGNRNPFIDHPEYVWAIFGTDTDGSGNIINNSQISVGGSGPAADGSSSAAVNLGQIIVNGSLGTSNVAFNKTGADPTTFDITTSGNAATIAGGSTNLIAGTGQGIDFGAQSRTITVGLNASTATAGLKSGTITVHNSDLTTAGAGQGSADANDTINVSATVLDHATASFSGSQASNSLTINVGKVGKSSGEHQVAFNLYNLVATVGFTAGLDLNSIMGSGDTGELTTTLSTFHNLAAGSNLGFDADIDTASLGSFSATYTLGLSDNALLSGAASTTPLTLTILANIVPFAPGDLNHDHHVDAADIVALMSALTDPSDFESQNGLSPSDLEDVGDVNGDGVMNNADLQALENDLIAGQGSTAGVPEPSSLLLLGLASLFLLPSRFCIRRCR